jgi:hypothetical protein
MPNIDYWNYSLQNPEPLIDDFYIFDTIIIDDKDFLHNVNRLRDLITVYCILKESLDIEEETKKSVLNYLVNSISEIIDRVANIQYTEFIAFWKTRDMSFSTYDNLFKNVKNHEKYKLLKKLLDDYCISRRKLYDKFGYTHTTIQALYDSGVSRKKGESGINKVLALLKEILGITTNNYILSKDQLINSQVGFFLPDQDNKSKNLFRTFLEIFNLKYDFGESHQGKLPDVVFKFNEHFFIIEAKHVKESGGAQDKQIVELINFISFREDNENIHYLSFLDGWYFNLFINPAEESKILKQKEAIVEALKSNSQNFFVNTKGFIKILEDLKT